MSLQVWLPLNNDLKNQGLNNVVVTNNGATYLSSGGKIGGGYQFEGNAYINTEYGNGISSNNLSIACWFKPTADCTNDVVFGTLNGSNQRFYVGIKNGTYNLAFGSTTYGRTTSALVITNEWVHIVMTAVNNEAKLYVNGEYIEKLSNSNSFSLASNIFIGGRSDGYKTNSLINDVRIYNHALSEQEIKELARGLVVHYPLNNNGLGTENLIVKTIYNSDPWLSAITNKSIEYQGKTCMLVQVYTLYNKTSSGTTTLFPGITFDNNTQYTLSWSWRDDYRTDNKQTNMYMRFKYTDGTYTTKTSSSDPSNEWTHNVLISTSGKTVSAITTTYGSGSSMYIADLKLEKGVNIKAKYSPSSIDFIDNTIIRDISGFQNNGTITGALSASTDTVRYKTSTYFNGSSYIKTDWGTFSWFDFNQCTLSIWMKPATTPSSYSGSFGIAHNSTDGYYSKCFSISNSSGKFNVQAASGGGWIWITPSYNIVANEWHHYVATLNETTVNMYIDGELIHTATLNWNTAKIASDTMVQIGVDFPGSDEIYTGYYSDARIYTTALSANDVQELYKMGQEVVT